MSMSEQYITELKGLPSHNSRNTRVDECPEDNFRENSTDFSEK